VRSRRSSIASRAPRDTDQRKREDHAAEAWLAEAQRKMADLNSEMVDLCIRYDETVTNAKETREKLLALIERACKDQQEAQKVKSERDELLQASERFQTELESIRHEHEHALGEREEARQACVIARRENTAEDQMKEATRMASWLAKEIRLLKPEVQSL
jgi:chromosome segregation ATPase